MKKIKKIFSCKIFGEKQAVYLVSNTLKRRRKRKKKKKKPSEHSIPPPPPATRVL
jgi:hypothetical protein